MPYIGKSPEMGVRTRYYYTVSAGATSVSGSDDNSKTLTFSDGEFVDVSLNGVALVAGTDYNTTTANTIAGLSAMSANDVVEVVVYDVFSVFSGDISGDLDVGGNLTGTTATLTTADNSDQLTLKSTDADANVGPSLNLHRNSSSPADNDVAGRIQFNSGNDNSQDVTYSEMYITTPDVSDGTEDGQLHIDTMVAGTSRSRVKLMPTETVFNENSIDLDFRVESNGNENMLFVNGGTNAVCIGSQDSGIAGTIDLSVGNTTNSGGITLFAPTNGIHSIGFADGTSGSDRYRGYIEYRHASDELNFATSATTNMSIDSTGAVTKVLQPAFSAKPTSQIDNLSVGGSDNTHVVFGTERFDTNADYNTSTGVFTAPVTGKYLLCFHLRLENIDTATTTYDFILATSNIAYTHRFDPDFGDSDTSYYHANLTVVADMDAGDTANVEYYVDAGTAQTDIDTNSYFMGYLLG